MLKYLSYRFLPDIFIKLLGGGSLQPKKLNWFSSSNTLLSSANAHAAILILSITNTRLLHICFTWLMTLSFSTYFHNLICLLTSLEVSMVE